jgi:spore germination cell wall hydrolase CwlJ-like protein
MNRTFRAAELSAAAAALCAALSFAAPSMANEIQRNGTGDAPRSYLAQLVDYAVQTVTGNADESSAAAAEAKPVAELVESFEAEAAPDREQDCLANAVYFEARGEPVEGQLAVAKVVLNRASSGRYPSDLCEVITQKAQFSFIRDGRFPAPDRASHAWRKAVAVAKIAREKLAASVPDDVLWYHASYVTPGWGKRLDKSAQIGLHVFYS